MNECYLLQIHCTRLYLNYKAIFPQNVLALPWSTLTRLLATSSNLLSSPSDIGLSPLSAKLDVLTRQDTERRGREAENPPLSPIQKHGFREGERRDAKCWERLWNCYAQDHLVTVKTNAQFKRNLCIKCCGLKFRKVTQNQRSRPPFTLQWENVTAARRCVGGHASADRRPREREGESECISRMQMDERTEERRGMRTMNMYRRNIRGGAIPIHDVGHLK